MTEEEFNALAEEELTDEDLSEETTEDTEDTPETMGDTEEPIEQTEEPIEQTEEQDEETEEQPPMPQRRAQTAQDTALEQEYREAFNKINPYTGRPIQSPEEFFAYKRQYNAELAQHKKQQTSNLYDRAVLKKAGAIAEKLGITWGGIWVTPDMPHFEITDNWKAPKEDEEMTQEQFNKFMDNWLAERRSLPVSDWAKEELEQAKAEGITDGTAPQAFATREQVAAMILRSKDK